MSKKNMELWALVEKTEPKIITEYTADDGTVLKNIAAINRIKLATEQFGKYGENWGLKNIEHSEVRVSNSILIGVAKAVFFVDNGDYKLQFEISNSVAISMVKDKIYSVNPSYRKSLETGIIGKALSRLGFNADIYTDDDLVKTEQQQEVTDEDLITLGENNGK